MNIKFLPVPLARENQEAYRQEAIRRREEQTAEMLQKKKEAEGAPKQRMWPGEYRVAKSPDAEFRGPLLST